MGLILNFHTISSAIPKKIRLYRLVIEISATEIHEAAIRPMTAGRIPACQSIPKMFVFLEFGKIEGHYKRKGHGNGQGTESTHDAAPNAEHIISHEGCGVYGDRTWGHFGYGYYVDKLLRSNPAVPFYDLTLYKREHGIAAAEGKSADFKKGESDFKCKVMHVYSPSFPDWRTLSAPAR